MNVKRLAAIDMYGTKGTARRGRIIQVEFAAGLATTVALGSWLVIEAADLGTRVLGSWLIGAGLNYAPLAVYAILLGRPGALAAELAGVDTGRELRRYGVLQLWILVPLALVAMTARRRTQAPGQLRRGSVLAVLGLNGAGKPDIGIRHFSTRVIIVPGHQQHYLPVAPVSLITTGSQHH